MKYSFGASLAVLCILSACGGGGGGGSIPLIATGTGAAALPTAAPNGLFVRANIREDADGSLSLTSVSDHQHAQLSATGNGDLTADGEVLGENLGVAFELTHSTFGLWGVEDGSGGQILAASTGNVTAPTNLPAANATFRGASAGVTRDDLLGSSYATASDVTVSVTNGFRDVAIESTNTQLYDLNSDATFTDRSYDFAGTGSVNGSSFSANVANDHPGFGLNGGAQGNFYGPSAEEVGGVFTLSGPDALYTGSFGAVR